MDKFLHFLLERRGLFKEELEGCSKNYYLSASLVVLIEEYDLIIEEYTKKDNVEDLGDVQSCKECDHSICFDKVIGRMYCGAHGSKVITKPDVIQDWCPLNKKK